MNKSAVADPVFLTNDFNILYSMCLYICYYGFIVIEMYLIFIYGG